jgi:hypothetical protein
MGRVDYIFQCLGSGPAGPCNIATYALNSLAAGDKERRENQGRYEKDSYKHLFRLHKK